VEIKKGKQCPSCTKLVGGRTHVCKCGYDFRSNLLETKKPEKEIKVFDKAGPGLKACPCGAYIALRTFVCPKCSYKFVPRSAPIKQAGVVYDEAGPKRKPCVCGKFAGSSQKTCGACGADFPDNSPSAKNSVYDEAGPKRKPCICGKFVGSSQPLCGACGHEFPVTIVEEKVRSNDPIENEGAYSAAKCNCGNMIVLTPSGVCPVKLRGTSQVEVQDWVDQVIVRGHNDRIHYSTSALRYWLREFFEIDSKEYMEAASEIRNLTIGEPEPIEIFEIFDEELAEVR